MRKFLFWPHLIAGVAAGIVILVMSVSAAGYVALRAVGPRLGIPLAALASGFISGIATIHAMGERSRRAPGLMAGLVSGALCTTQSSACSRF